MTELLTVLKQRTGSYQNLEPKIHSLNPVLRLLIVDDNPDDLDRMRRMLANSKHRFQIIEAETGTAALKICQENPPDCVLLDYHLPDFEAPDFLAELGGEKLPWCPVVVITGLTDGLSGAEIIKQGAQDFIGKSWINPESLVRAIENAIERYQLLRELRDQKQLLIEALRDNEYLLSASQRHAHIGSWSYYPDYTGLWGAPKILE